MEGPVWACIGFARDSEMAGGTAWESPYSELSKLDLETKLSPRGGLSPYAPW